MNSIKFQSILNFFFLFVVDRLHLLLEIWVNIQFTTFAMVHYLIYNAGSKQGLQQAILSTSDDGTLKVC